MRQSDQLDQIAGALAKAQADCRHANIDSAGNIPGRDGKPGFSYKYASLGSVLDAIKPALAANALALTMSPVCEDGRAGVDWILMHESGQWMADRLVFRLAQDTPQAVGSAITYARRYTSAALLGISAEDDDDAGSISHGSEKPRAEAQHARSAAAAQPKPKRPDQMLTAAIAAKTTDVNAAQALPKVAAYVIGPDAGVPNEDGPAQYLAAVIAAMDPADLQDIVTAGRVGPPEDPAPRWLASMLSGRIKSAGVSKFDSDARRNLALWAGIPTANWSALTRSEAEAARKLLLASMPDAIVAMTASAPPGALGPDNDDPFADE